eukprot:TRINITY_DN28001_c0_g1_i1.p1 TRINITY_DN28001_c0_g1~~TRINITY_DN28001_c0_g1_i1.p1  ORF type:complete len:385 (-),score=80.82 TRINITY_DN28001_c0_g1_i1:116-1225(-)
MASRTTPLVDPDEDVVERLQAALNASEERARSSETRIAELCAESRETASYCAVVTKRFDKQVELNATLQKMLRQCEAQVESLKCEVRELQRGEAEYASKVAAKEAAVSAWREERLKELPDLKHRLVAQAQQQRNDLQEQFRKRIATSALEYHEQVRDVHAELSQARRDNAELGRKCYVSYENVRRAEDAALHWQQYAVQAKQELQEQLRNSEKTNQRLRQRLLELGETGTELLEKPEDDVATRHASLPSAKATSSLRDYGHSRSLVTPAVEGGLRLDHPIGLAASDRALAPPRSSSPWHHPSAGAACREASPLPVAFSCTPGLTNGFVVTPPVAQPVGVVPSVYPMTSSNMSAPRVGHIGGYMPCRSAG